MHKLIIAEKPSVCRDISRVVGANEQIKETNITYYKGNGYIVANAMGHFCTLAQPKEYGYGWDIRTFPMSPDVFKVVPTKGHEQHLTALAKLMNSKDVTSLICATDAGREGVLIFRYIYDYSGCNKPYEHLWISSLTDESIKNGMKNLRSSTEKFKVYEAGFCRAKSDWLIGMNMSRIYKIYYLKTFEKYGIGRVTTPTLEMIAQRDREIANFVKRPFFTLSLENCASWFTHDGEEKIKSVPTKAEAERIKSRCIGKTAKVVKADKAEKKENRPLLFSLTSLQQEANEQHGFSSARTLVTAQDLYLKKLLTYPRTDSNYLSSDMKNQCAVLVGKLTFFDKAQADKLTAQGLNLDKRIVNDAKVSDHHAIIPTSDIAKMQTIELTPDEKTILDMVIKRFLTTLDQQHIYDETQYIFDVDGETFELKHRESKSLGWRDYVKAEKENDGKPCVYVQGDTFIVNNITIGESETRPPKPFTEATLLAAMENISRRIDDKDKAEFVKERGLGTPATRAAIIEKLLEFGYIQRVKKNLHASELGVKLLDILPDVIKNVELTADIESMLSDIESGAVVEQTVITAVIKIVNAVLETEKAKEHPTFESDRPSLGKCPKCGKNVVEYPKSFSCENQSGCDFILWKNDYFWTEKEKELTAEIVAELLTKGKALVKGLISKKTGKPYDAIITLCDYESKGTVKTGFKMDFVEKDKPKKKVVKW